MEFAVIALPAPDLGFACLITTKWLAIANCSIRRILSGCGPTKPLPTSGRATKQSIFSKAKQAAAEPR
jgi:hypothetical protein